MRKYLIHAVLQCLPLLALSGTASAADEDVFMKADMETRQKKAGAPHSAVIQNERPTPQTRDSPAEEAAMKADLETRAREANAPTASSPRTRPLPKR